MLAGLPVSIIEHPNWSNGLGSSIAVGVKHAVTITAKLDAVILLSCDQPFVNAATLRQLIQLHLENGKTIVASAYAETLGIPALFDRSCFDDLLQAHEATVEPKELFLPGDTMLPPSIFPLPRSTSTPLRITKNLIKPSKRP